MEDTVIIKNDSNGYIYMVIPEEYMCVYNELLGLLSNLGIDMIKDCAASCKGNSKNIINCWNMFQTACAAYSIKEVKKADLIIKYIMSTLKLSCPNFIRVYDAIVYFGDSSIEVTNDMILQGDSVNYLDTSFFEVPFYKTTNYIAVPLGVTIDFIENKNVGGEYLYNRETGEDLYVRSRITLNDKQYILWACTLEDALLSNVYVKLVKGEEELIKNLYCSEITHVPDVEDILSTEPKDTTKFNIFKCKVYKIGHFIAVPYDVRVESIQNDNFGGDWLYNEDLGIDLYTRSSITINNKPYYLWYYETIIPLNGYIKIIIKQ